MIHTQRTRTRPHNNVNNKVIFSTGALLFLIGFVGMIYNLWINPHVSASSFLPDNTVILAEFNTKKANLEELQEFNITHSFDEVLSQNLPAIAQEDFVPWVGNRVALAWLPNEDFVLAARYRSKTKARTFMEKFLVEGESFGEQVINGSVVYSPEFSSQVNFMFRDKWLIVTTSRDSLLSILGSEAKLSQLANYQEIDSDLPRRSDVRGYVNFGTLFNSDMRAVSAYKPLIRALSKTIPAAGVSIQISADTLDVQSKLVTTEGVFSSELLKNTPNELIPELSKYAKKDTLFFMNGYDLDAKYLHTKSFLQDFHPQLSLIFDGVLRSEFKKIFGENFDFQTDLLNRVKGQYALIFNTTDEETPFVYFTMITQFGAGTTLQNSEDIKAIIKKAQQNYSTKIVDYELPDGSNRRELVLVDPSEISLQEKTESSLSYFTAETNAGESAVPNQQFSYGFLDNFLIFSNHEQGIKDVFNAYTEQTNLTQNEDFRESILFDFSASESYGFINGKKLDTFLETSKELSEANESDTIHSFLKSIRTISFARKTFPGKIIFSAILNKR